MKVICDVCGHRFKMKKAKKVRRINEDIEEVYFECPHCETDYHSYYINDEIRDLILENIHSDDLNLIRENKYKIREIEKRIGDELGRSNET